MENNGQEELRRQSENIESLKVLVLLAQGGGSLSHEQLKMLESRVKDVQQRFDALTTKVNEKRRQVDTLKELVRKVHEQQREAVLLEMQYHE